MIALTLTLRFLVRTGHPYWRQVQAEMIDSGTITLP
jgi:hypothetical protein